MFGVASISSSIRNGIEDNVSCYMLEFMGITPTQLVYVQEGFTFPISKLKHVSEMTLLEKG